MTWYLGFLVVVSLAVSGCLCENELFKNPGMEDPDIIGAYGQSWGYSMERDEDRYSGNYSVKLSNR